MQSIQESMSMRTYTLALVLIIIVLAPIQGASAQENPKGILYWANVKDGVEIHIYYPAQRTDNVFLKIEKTPRFFKWTIDMKTLFYAEEEDLYKVEWKWGAKPEKLFSIPLEVVNNDTFLSTWIDKSTNRWRLVYVYEVFRELDLIIIKEKGKQYYYLLHDNEKVLVDSTFKVGWHGLAVVQEYVPRQGWQTIAKRVTDCQAQSSPCLDVIKDLVNPLPMVSSGLLRSNMRISNKFNSAEWIEGSPRRGIAYIPSFSVKNRGIKVKVDLGDSYHAITPLIYVNKDTNVEIVIYKKDTNCNDFSQIGFEEHDGFLLVGTEYSSECARVIDMRTGKTVLTPLPDSSVVWIEIPKNGQDK